jgi:large subunit ribosomal protein L6
MSRIGKKLITLPQGVELEVQNNLVTVSGPKGKLSQEIDKQILVKKEGNIVSLTRTNETPDARAKHGLYRSLINNMVEGVTKGFSKKLEINGVGFKATKQGNKLVINLGFSHDCIIEEVPGITLSCPSATEILVSGIDKQLVGQIASNIRDLKPVEPYHAYGVKYSDEVVIRKVGKTAGKGKK